MFVAFLQALINDHRENSGPGDNNLHLRERRRRNGYRWLYKNIFSTFRYGMVLLYVGTLLVVIGYHNPSIIFARSVL